MPARHVSTQRRSPRGHVVVTFVDGRLRRRSVAVPFARSDAESVQELLAYVDEHVPLDAPGVYDNGG